MGDKLSPDFASVQAHYDLSNEFFALFLDETMTYTCAFFPTEGASLREAQVEKVDRLLAKCQLSPGMRLLEIGCGWGFAAMRAHRTCGVQVVANTLSRQQHEHNQELVRGTSGVDFRLEGWESFCEPVDRILAIGALEHFGRDRYSAFFARCRELLPADGLAVIHTNTQGRPSGSFAFLRFVKWVSQCIFPGAYIPPPEMVVQIARQQGLELRACESLRMHYVRTLEHWLHNLRHNREVAEQLVGSEVYANYDRYMSGYAGYFRSGECNLHQFVFGKV